MANDLERDKQDRHETPVGVRYTPNSSGDAGDHSDFGSRKRDGSLVDTRPLWGPHNVPNTIEEALIVCAPFQEPQLSLEEIHPEEMEVALALLTDKERSVIEFLVFGQMSLSQAGVWLGEEYGRKPYSKQGVSNIRDSALRKMRKHYEVLSE